MTNKADARKGIEKFLMEDGLDISCAAFKYLVIAIEKYKPGIEIEQIAEPVMDEFGIKPWTFKNCCGKLVKSSKTFPEATLRKYVAYVYGRTMLK